MDAAGWDRASPAHLATLAACDAAHAVVRAVHDAGPEPPRGLGHDTDDAPEPGRPARSRAGGSLGAQANAAVTHPSPNPLRKTNCPNFAAALI